METPTNLLSERAVERPGGPSGARRHVGFRYRLVDLAGSDVAVVERDDPLRPDDVVLVASRFQETAWRVVSVLGKCAVVTGTQNALRYEVLFAPGEASRGIRRFASDEDYEVGDRLYLGGEVWWVEQVKEDDDLDGRITRLLCASGEREG